MSNLNSRPPNDKLFQRYLTALGVSFREPGLDALQELTATHLTRVPFENVSKLYYKKHNSLRGLPSLELYLDGIENYNFGGTCYTNNYYLNLLLKYIGYDVKLCGAGMTNPDVHIVNIVTLEGREYLVDVGYAAPLLKPLPRDLDQDQVVALGRDRYVLKPQDEQNRSRVEMYRDNELIHGYTAKPTPRPIQYFDEVIAGSFSEGATFMNALLLVRFNVDRSVAIYNYNLIESNGPDYRIVALADKDELVRTIVDRFAMPSNMVKDVLADMAHLSGDAWT
jgi:arylamine N-acetyltransferase